MTQKKLLYIVATNLEHNGLKIKFEGQTDCFNTHFKSKLLPYLYKNTDNFIIKLFHYLYFEYQVFVCLLSHHIIYFRYDPKPIFTHFWLLLFSFFKPIYIEHNGIYSKSLLTQKRPLEWCLHQLVFHCIKWLPFKHVAVTKQIQDYLIQEGFNKPTAFYAQNGYQIPTPEKTTIDPKLLEKIKSLQKSNKPIGIFVGNGFVWHGIDEIISLFKTKDASLIIIGSGYNINKTEDNILYLGPLPHHIVQKIYSYCNFGIGTFKFDLNGLTQSSTLKTRDYLCHGLPILVNHYDCAEDFDELKPFIFNYYLNKKSFDLICNQTIDQNQIKTIAQQKLSWDNVYEDIISDMKESV